jgi:hypothetical protein
MAPWLTYDSVGMKYKLGSPNVYGPVEAQASGLHQGKLREDNKAFF